MLEEPPAGRVARTLNTSSPQRTGIAMNLLDALELLKQPISEPASDRDLFSCVWVYSASSQDISSGSAAPLFP